MRVLRSRNEVSYSDLHSDYVLEPDTEKREIEIPLPLQKELGTELIQKLNSLSFTHKKEFIVWYSQAKQRRKAHLLAE